ncbi:helix-turn-helix domain-containing protein [Pseudoclavibacter sp. JSM 162008]|uniref:helix-turn-helix domain-containing protein n=1 Tax=Pseudoclavibacter sp. JSM 162008 TaxID=3229855 RepID=UPI003526BF1F
MDKRRRREHLGQVLARLRQQAGLSQADVAVSLQRPQSFVSKYEAAQRRVDVPELEDIAAALGLTLEAVVAAYQEQSDAS